jgi:hypothetical protein
MLDAGYWILDADGWMKLRVHVYYPAHFISAHILSYKPIFSRLPAGFGLPFGS